MTSYDDIYKSFSGMTLVDNYYLPSSDESLYVLIDNARKIYNMTLYRELQQDDSVELLDASLNDLEMLLLCHCMRLVTFKNMVSEFTSMVSTVSKDNALKDYKAQIDGRNILIEVEQKTINRLALSLLDMESDL